MIKIDHIVFDIGHVLLHWDREIPYRRLIPDDAERQWFLDNVCTPDWNLEQDRGRSWTEGEELLIAQFPNQAANIRAYREYWPEMVSHHHEVTADLLRAMVADGKDVTLLTNFAADTLDLSRERFDFLTLARGATVSGEVGLIKPDPAIYEHHQEAFALNPSATLFLDDNAANVEAARSQGWHSIHVEDPMKVPAQLRDFAI